MRDDGGVKFSLAINPERMDPSEDMRAVMTHTLEMVQMAEVGGFEIAWAAEHHAIEMTVAPGPFALLTWWAAHTSTIRLGTAVLVAPYWHPIRLAGEVGQLDLLSNGRVELGLGRGAYQREYDRVSPGTNPVTAAAALRETLPVLKGLWAGDFAYDGDLWSFPEATACPKPVQSPHPPVWVAARDPDTYDWAVANGCNIMCWPLTRPFAELEAYVGRLDAAVAKCPVGTPRPRQVAMRYSAVVSRSDDLDPYIRSLQSQAGRFENLFKGLGGVSNGFADPVDLESLSHRAEYDPAMLRENLMFGTPDEVIAKLRLYEGVGVDFIYCPSYGAPMEAQKRSLRLFIDEVMPAFASST